MLSNYDVCLNRVLKDEGGYTNEATDPGGPTNYGITIGDYRHYVKPDATAADIKNMSLADAKQIYRARYWDAQRCSDLPSGVDYAIFDYGVNSGIGRSQKVLQRFVNVPIDGVIGPVTLAATLKQDPARLVDEICSERLAFLKGLSTWSTYGRGWETRVAGVRAFANQLAKLKAPNKAAGPAAAGAVVVAGTAAATQASPEHWMSIMGIVLVAAIVIGVIIHEISNSGSVAAQKAV